MVIEDNFIEILPGDLIDPVLKLTLRTAGHKEAYAFDETDLNLSYDPEIRADRLTSMPSPEEQERLRKHPLLIKSADRPGIFISKKRTLLVKYYLEWQQPKDILIIKLKNYIEYMSTIKKDVNVEFPKFYESDRKAILLYGIRSLVKMHSIRGYDLKKTYPDLERIDVCIPLEMARGFFDHPTEELDEVEPGWVCVATRRAVQ
jgi:hypothetical protein